MTASFTKWDTSLSGTLQAGSMGVPHSKVLLYILQAKRVIKQLNECLSVIFWNDCSSKAFHEMDKICRYFMNLIKLRAYFYANCLKLILTKLYTLTTRNMCNRTSILRKKSFQLLKPFLETKKGTINVVATHRDLNGLSVFEDCTMHPFNYACSSLSTQPSTMFSWVVLLFLVDLLKETYRCAFFVVAAKLVPNVPNILEDVSTYCHIAPLWHNCITKHQHQFSFPTKFPPFFGMHHYHKGCTLSGLPSTCTCLCIIIHIYWVNLSTKKDVED